MIRPTESGVLRIRGTEKYMMSRLVEFWPSRSGAPQFFIVDPDFCQSFSREFLKTHGIELKRIPARTSHENGHVEGNNTVFKNVLSKD